MIQNKLFHDSLAAIPDEQKAEFELSFGIAERMDAILKEKNISQRELARRLGKRESEVSRWLTGRQDLAEAELAQVEVLESYLPKQLSQEEIEAEVKKIIAEVGATSMKEMGKVMGTASKQLAGKADGRIISEIVKRLLA